MQFAISNAIAWNFLCNFTNFIELHMKLHEILMQFWIALCNCEIAWSWIACNSGIAQWNWELHRKLHEIACNSYAILKIAYELQSKLHAITYAISCNFMQFECNFWNCKMRFWISRKCQKNFVDFFCITVNVFGGSKCKKSVSQSLNIFSIIITTTCTYFYTRNLVAVVGNLFSA